MNPEPLPFFALYRAAFALQVPAVALFAAYAFRPRRGLSLAATLCLAASALLHLAFAAALGWRQGRLPLASGFEALSAWGLLLTALVVQVEWRHRLGLLGAFLAPLSALTLLMGFRFARAAAEVPAGLSQGWLLAHVACSMASYALFTAAAGAAGALLVQEHQLKNKRLEALSYDLPPLTELEALLARLCLAGLGALGLGLLAGFIWRLGLAQAPLLDAKVDFSLLMALLWALALGARRRGWLKGRRFGLAAVALFLLLFFGFYLVNLYLGGHAFLRAPAA